jgi:hypothetical protein
MSSRSLSLTLVHAAAAAAAAALGVLVLQYVVARPDEDALREFVVTCAIIGAATAVVFGWVLPRATARGGSPRTALTLSLLGLLFAAAYWSGLPPVLAIGGIVLGRRSGDDGLARGAVAVGILALLADAAAVVADGALG